MHMDERASKMENKLITFLMKTYWKIKIELIVKLVEMLKWQRIEGSCEVTLAWVSRVD